MKQQKSLVDMLDDFFASDESRDIPNFSSARVTIENNKSYGLFGCIKKYVDEHGKLPVQEIEV